MNIVRLSPERKQQACIVAFAAVLPLYLLLVSVAEPLRAFAVTANTVVQMQITGALSMTCTSVSTITSAPGSGTSGTGSLGAASCNPNTNGALGYTLSWLINSSTGSTSPVCVGNCYGTGHLLSNNVTAGKPDTIRSFDRKGTFVNAPGRFDNTTILTGSGSRWAARLRANSTTPGGATVTWGADGATEGFLNVATGSAINIAKRNNATGASSDVENFLFKVVIPSSVFQPTGTYKATVVLTAVDN